MAQSSRVLALFCVTATFLLVYSIDSDLYFTNVGHFIFVNEDVGSVYISISSRASVERKAYLYFYSSSIPRATPQMDYEFANINASLHERIFNFTISPDATRSFEVTIIDDNIAEVRREYTQIHLYAYGFTGIDYIDSRLICIEDNDGAYFVRISTNVHENIGNAERCVTYPSRDDLPQTYNASITLNGDYEDGDFTSNAIGVPFILTAGDTVCFNVTIIDDDVNERTEWFYFDLNHHNGFNTERADTICIVVFDDEEAAYVGFEKTSYSVLESDGVVTVCLTVDRGDGTEEFYLYLFIANLTTQGGADHEQLPRYQVTFLIDENIQCFNINITDDDIEEDVEFFEIFFDDSLSYSGIYPLTRSPRIYPLSTARVAVITIYDDDSTCNPECVNGVCRDPGVCVCDEGWTDEDCSHEIQVCQVPCGDNGVCNVDTGNCDCSPGYTGAPCEDIPDCDIDNGNCEQICTNFIGGYNCSCKEGFLLSEEDLLTCNDINECMEEDHSCNQICVNTPGSYYCNCEPGFQLNSVTGCEDVNECSVLPNGFCSQVCVNMYGSYHCECMEGYQLVRASFCEDIDECVEMSDACDKSQPAPADCINLSGSHRCSCGRYSGHRLSADGTTCEDVDECSEGMHLCTDMCANTPGSYSCSCPAGFELDSSDGLTCHDINECGIMNGGCDHGCSNTYGSFNCSCNRGHLLLEDGLKCQALKCLPMLEAPLNGNIQCDTQAVGETCTFSCDEGFTLRGSESRYCTSSLQWTGRPTVCDPPMCPALRPPSNGLVSFPCTREEGDTCSVTCAHGYNSTGPDTQECKRETEDLIWSKGPQCVESDPCFPNPCYNGGNCVKNENQISCEACDTGYGGPTCKSRIIYFSPIPSLKSESTFSVRLFTIATLTQIKKVTVTVTSVDKTEHFVLYLRPFSQESEIDVRDHIGIVTISMPVMDNNFIYEPEMRTVFLSGSARDGSFNDFSLLNLTRGLLKPSCCRADNLVTLSCPGNSTEIVSLRSPCAWSTVGQVIETAGIVFAEGSNLSLPTSISGLRYRNDNRYINEPLQRDKRCDLCSTCNGTGSECYCYTHTPANTQEFLIARALAFTYITEMSQLLPPWLNMFVDLSLTLDSSPISDYDMFAKVTRPMEQVSSIDGCGKLTGLENGVYSVMRHDKTLSVVIDGERYDYRENADTGSTGDTMCFAVDLCHESDSPVHMQISQPINDILVSEYLHQFSGHIRNIQFKTVSLFKHPNLVHSQTPFWNGTHMINVSPVEADVSLSADVGLEFTDGDLMIRLDFDGNGDLNYRGRDGLLDGQFELFLETTIDGAKRQFLLINRDSVTGYCNISESDVWNDAAGLRGISFSAVYEPQPYFNRILQFTETTQECSFQVYLPVDADFSIQGLSLHTECPLLALSELIFPEMSHTLNFIGSKTNCFGSDFLGVSDPALVIESELINNRLRLGNILQLQPDSDGPDILTVYGRGADSGYTARFSNMQVSLFGAEFEANANIVNNMMDIAAISSVFGYPAELAISAPSNLSDWGELMLTVQGSLLPGEGSFLQKLSNEVLKKLTKLGNSGKKRREVAQMSLDQSKERFRLIDEQFMLADLNVTQAEQRKNATREDIVTIQEQLTNLEREFNSSQDDLTGLMEQLDASCTEQLCEDVCMPGESCRNCTRPTFVVKRSKCPIMVQEARTVRIYPFYTTVPTWVFVLECRLENNLICQNVDCPVGERENCHGKCVSIKSEVPVYNWAMVEVDVYTYENCTLEVFNGSVPDTCCENVNCAVFAADPSCVSGNAMCRVARQEALDNVEDLRDESRELFQRLLKARMNLSLAKIAAKRADIDCEIYKQRRDQLEMSRDRLKDACDKSVEVHERTLEEITSLVNIYDNGNENGYENIFKINNVTFDERLTNSPSSLALNIAFEKTIDGNTTEYDDNVFVYVSQLNEANFDRIADGIIDISFFGKTKRSIGFQARIGRQAPQELTQRQIFDSRCAHLSNIQLFFVEIQASLMEVQESIEGSRNSSSSLSQTLTDEGPPEDEEFSAYLDLVRGYEELSMEALFTLESTIFSEWQAGMELLYSESGSVGEASCDGFADCLQTAVDELQNLIDLTPKEELNEEFLSLESNIPMAETSLLELALLSDISIDEGLTKIEPIIEITSAYTTNNYWCNKPPVMIIQPPPEVNVSLGGTLNLSCKAESNLAVTYHWERDGSVLPQFTTNELVIPMVQRRDSANYTCFANNPVGQAESITTSVTVYEVPEFYLTPESVVTYFGDGNGAWFACNATAWPYPGWRWFHRKNASENWMMIEGENTNELLILNPQQEDEGMYACEAYNYHGSIRSEPASLTLLPFTVSQHRFPLLFTVISSNQSCNLDELYIYDSLYSLISETISGETVIIEDFNITEVDNETYDVSLSLTSENVTTYYLNFLTFAEIANLALPYATSLRRSVQLIEDLIEGNINGLICPGPVTVESFVVGRLTYVCPPGQRLNSDYLLCLSCERGQISTEIERSRIVNGVGYTENVAVCEACPLDT